MSNEDLLKPRYKVVAFYPNSQFYIGTILTLNEFGAGKWWHKFTDEEPIHLEEGAEKRYPSILEKLKWWEERTSEEMPKFLKLFYNDKNQYVHKVENWTGENNMDGQPLYEYFNKVNYLSTSCVSDLLPATEEEYNEYRSTLRVIA